LNLFEEKKKMDPESDCKVTADDAEAQCAFRGIRNCNLEKIEDLRQQMCKESGLGGLSVPPVDDATATVLRNGRRAAPTSPIQPGTGNAFSINNGVIQGK